MLLKNQIAVIAGDAYGVGHAAAALFAREGAHVVCIDDNAGFETAKTLRLGELEVPYFHADVTAWKSCVYQRCEPCRSPFGIRLIIIFPEYFCPGRFSHN